MYVAFRWWYFWWISEERSHFIIGPLLVTEFNNDFFYFIKPHSVIFSACFYRYRGLAWAAATYRYRITASSRLLPRYYSHPASNILMSARPSFRHELYFAMPRFLYWSYRAILLDIYFTPPAQDTPRLLVLYAARVLMRYRWCRHRREPCRHQRLVLMSAPQQRASTCVRMRAGS